MESAATEIYCQKMVKEPRCQTSEIRLNGKPRACLQCRDSRNLVISYLLNKVGGVCHFLTFSDMRNVHIHSRRVVEASKCILVQYPKISHDSVQTQEK